jgi:NADH-quinone oxidoreductase subunit C
MKPREIHDRLKEKFGEAILLWNEEAVDPFCVVDPDRILEIATYLRDDPDLRFDFLMCHTGIDYPPQHIAVVLHLCSYPKRHTFVLKMLLDREKPEVDSVSGIWPTAEWLERECYDLLGVVFRGHRDLRRLLLPEDWVGWPLRKDYQEPATYHGIPTTRPDPMELVALGSAQASSES